MTQIEALDSLFRIRAIDLMKEDERFVQDAQQIDTGMFCLVIFCSIHPLGLYRGHARKI